MTTSDERDVRIWSCKLGSTGRLVCTPMRLENKALAMAEVAVEGNNLRARGGIRDAEGTGMS